MIKAEDFLRFVFEYLKALATCHAESISTQI